MSFAPEMPVVAVVIPCFNYGHFLAQAIDSVLQQTYQAIEIVVVDDGSTDNTQEIARRYPQVRYVYQKNQGLSAARNRGIAQSTGEYLVFLDADDWLLPEALAINAALLQQHPEWAFCYGAYVAARENGKQVTMLPPPSDKPYLDLLAKGNFIAMIATVMFRRWVMTDFAFDTSLHTCEDYDLYLRIAYHHPVGQHKQPLAAYRIHTAGMSAAIPAMLGGALQVLGRQRAALRNPAEKEAYYNGVHFWKAYYSAELRAALAASRSMAYWPAMLFFAKYSPRAGIGYNTGIMKAAVKATLKKMLPTAAVRSLRRLSPHTYWVPPVGEVEGGDFRRLQPFSRDFGYSRGGPVDRYYIERFLAREAPSIRGRVLEIGDNAYTTQYGAAGGYTSDILHIDDTNPRATFVGDLSAAPQLPDGAFDCIILTQTLHLIYDFRGALATCYRILKPDGTLLLTAPGLTPIDRDEWGATWYWSFTDKVLKRLMGEFFADAEITVGSFGNVWAATAFLYGMGLSEVKQEELDYYDPQFQVINTIKAVKPRANA
ncbi:glycosyltransferase [Hymenobacter cheonanensis]|uniref:glycosyltransferase n=1 Tax=Hymenobacter sp. CA2-7 TaxID=3063993 RepID=UPI0027142851|nr:glycosyltransferase [Hymenobacter sp. CA2-7]MDO7885544.1 glycosyltransferase [Hymenobacter sp. CA2-7]